GGAPVLEPAEIDLTTGPALATGERGRERDPARARGFQTFFGDIQQHSAHSDGIGSADEPYLRARHRYGDDFVALTDHESFLGKRTGPGEWEYLQAVADRHDAPGEFATLIAYEWTGKMYPGPGHKCVYFPRRGMPLVSRDDVPRGKDLVERIKALGGIASPHHIGWTGCDEEGHDPAGQPVWEICSCHGCYEHANHPLGQRGEHVDQLVDAMLKKGHRFGFTAASDSHGLLYHHGECRKRDPFRTGLTAVQARELSREAVFDALRARRCYATSGAKIFLDVTVNGEPMGSELRGGGSLDVEVRAVGESTLDRIEIMGPGGVLHTAYAEGDEVSLSTVVSAPFVYARVIQRDGEMAWSSPVFVD
ncbi:MAG: CehA/McbA family metallohydrolase, partial [Polyangiaceae bacterium]|nr:CehA/McbA family metallohydrolase [Polyangiaceae bacterium]